MGESKSGRMRLTQERVKELFDYNPETGIVTRLRTVTHKAKRGDVVGHPNAWGGLVVGVDGNPYPLHCVIWLMVTGALPDRLIHHKNGVGTDNRWCNLEAGLQVSKKYRKRLGLTQERVRELLDYVPETGRVTRKITLSKGMNQHCNSNAGDAIVSLTAAGYYRICIDGYRYLLHRVIWLWMEGYWPEHSIDHISRDKTDNRWCNLRPVSHQCNMRNTGVYAHNTSGIKGVSWYSKPKKWCGSIKINGINMRLGQFTDIVEATAHRLAAEQCLGWAGCDSNSPAYQYMQEYVKRES